jgi:transcriptional regulator with XRE-family HTH domain
MFAATADSATASHETSSCETSPSNSVDAYIGSRLRIRRTSCGMNQDELSKLIGVDRRNLATHEVGAQRINASLLLRIANVLDVRPGYFFQGYVDNN